MDIARPDLARKKRMRHSLYSVSALIVIALVTVGVSRLEPAAPRVDRDTIYLDTVQRGPMVRQVRGTGTLVPEQIRWIPATTDGTVERIVIRPGALVAPDTVILELSNPELEQSALEARLNLEAAEARYSNRQVEVERELLNQRATLATIEAQLKTARLQADADGQLFAQGLVASLQLQQSQSAEQEYETRYALERERLQMATDTVEAQLAVEQAEVDRLRTLYELRLQQVAAASRAAARRPPGGGRPARARLFRVEADGTHASRMRVSLGRASVNTIEVLDGLQPGDRVVLSDMSTWDQFDRVRIE